MAECLHYDCVLTMPCPYVLTMPYPCVLTIPYPYDLTIPYPCVLTIPCPYSMRSSVVVEDGIPSRLEPSWAIDKIKCRNFANENGMGMGTKTKTKTEWERERKRERKRNGNGNENGNENESGNGNGNENGNYEGTDLIEFMRPDSCFSISTIRFSRSACCSSDTYPMFLAINSWVSTSYAEPNEI